MAVDKGVLYIKASQNVEVSVRDVTLGDLISMEYMEQFVVNKLKTLKLLKIPEKGSSRQVVSILEIIARIHEEYPNLEVQNLGPADVIVTYEEPREKNRALEILKVFLVTLITFVGSAFAIMAFNNDSGATDIFAELYLIFLGTPKTEASVLELTYSVGIFLGIIVFFNHFGKRKFTVDPTPIEVEMRLYEQDIQTTLIDDYERRGKELDRCKVSSSGHHRS